MQLINYLYLATGVVFLLGFIPQIVKLWKDKTGAASVSLATWAMFSTCSIISLLYATQSNHDINFILTSSAGVLGNLIVLGLACWRRVARQEARHRHTQ